MSSWCVGSVNAKAKPFVLQRVKPLHSSPTKLPSGVAHPTQCWPELSRWIVVAHLSVTLHSPESSLGEEFRSIYSVLDVWVYSVAPSCLTLCGPMDCQAPLPMEFFRQEY